MQRKCEPGWKRSAAAKRCLSLILASVARAPEYTRRPWEVNGLRQQLLNHVAMHVGQAAVDAAGAEGEAGGGGARGGEEGGGGVGHPGGGVAGERGGGPCLRWARGG